jgi:hypothetical protein
MSKRATCTWPASDYNQTVVTVRLPFITAWAGVAFASACAGGEEPVRILINGTASGLDDFVVLSDPAEGDRPFTEAFLLLLDPELAPLAVELSSEGSGAVSLEPQALILNAGEPAAIRIYGDRASLGENDTQIEVRRSTPDGPLLAREDLTVVSGVKIAFQGTFSFVTENNNGFRASSQGAPFESCDGVADPLVWRATPLPCEGLASFNQLQFDEGSARTRWAAETGKRPLVAVQVSAIHSFGPTIDLSGRDPRLSTGTLVTGPAGGTVATLFTDDCDGNPLTGDPNGQEQGVEVVSRFALSIGDHFTVAYRDDSADTSGRIWTRFPSPATEEEAAADAEHVDAVLFADGESGCSSPDLTFFSSNGRFRCRETQTVRELLLRNAGLRSMIRRAWANWTSRRMVATGAPGASDSFIARLFLAGASAGSGQSVEAFLQLTDYDWYTLVGRVEKGLVSTPGGIPPRFREWTASAGCPFPREPDLAFEDDPS